MSIIQIFERRLEDTPFSKRKCVFSKKIYEKMFHFKMHGNFEWNYRMKGKYENGIHVQNVTYACLL